MIYLVDNTIDGQGPSPRELKAALERIRPGLEIIVEPFRNVSLKRVQEVSPSHIILSGQSHPWDLYTSGSLAGVFDVRTGCGVRGSEAGTRVSSDRDGGRGNFSQSAANDHGLAFAL